MGNYIKSAYKGKLVFFRNSANSNLDELGYLKNAFY